MIASRLHTNMKVTNWAIMALILTFSHASIGAGYYRMTEDEIQLCKKMFGVTTGSGEHICDCVRDYNRASRETKLEDVKYYAQDSTDSCGYFMGRHTVNSGNPMDQYYPTAQMYRGMAYVLLKNHTKAALDLNEALRRNPGLQDAYSQLADMYSGLGNKHGALTIVTEGLKNLPASKPLRRRYLALGGKEPFPEPYHPATETPPTAEAQSDKGKVERHPQVATDHLATVPPTPEQRTKSTSGNKPEAVGSPTDPWCRFCPDTAPAPAGNTPATPGVIPNVAR